LEENDNKTDNKILEGERAEKTWDEVKKDVQEIF
jgi:hypothetical protein